MESRINVWVRIKPLKKCEEANEKNNLWTVSDESMVFNTRTNESYSFDKVMLSSDLFSCYNFNEIGFKLLNLHYIRFLEKNYQQVRSMSK